MRRTIAALAAAVLGAVAILAVWRHDTSSPSGSSTQDVARAPADGTTPPRRNTAGTTCPAGADEPTHGGLGISPGYTLVSDDQARVDRELDGMAAAGVCWVRIDIDWSRIEREPEEFDWAATDRAVEGTRRRGMKVLGLLGYTPEWARPEGTSDKHPPSEPGEFAAFAETAASRYRPLGVHTWEIWNEPNIDEFWEPRADAASYAVLLRNAARAIRGVDPRSIIVAGGLSPASDTDSSMAPVTFLDALYEAGAADSFDAVGMHPYTYPLGPLDRGPLNHFITVTPELRDVMIEHGDAEADIWATEFGAPTGTSEQSVSPDGQADQLAQALEQWQSWEWSGPLFIYSWRDRGVNESDRESNFGLLYHDFQPKPALGVLLSVTGGTPP